MNTLGMRLISAIVDTKDSSQFVTNGINRKLLSESEGKVYDFVSGHIQKYAQMPSREVIDQKFASQGIALPQVQDGAKFYSDEVRKRFIHNELVQAFNDAAPWINAAGAQNDPEKALSIITNKCMGLTLVSKGGQILDFREASQVVMRGYHDAMYGVNEDVIFYGWDSLDKESSGARGGDLLSVIGRPAMGKTFMLLKMAMYAWYVQHKPTLFLTMEMLPAIISTRMAAMFAHLNLGLMQKGQLSTPTFQKLKTGLETAHAFDTPFWIVDGNLSATVEDLWNLAQTMGPAHIVIDGAYLMQHPNPRLNRFDRVAENTRLMKSALATSLNTPVSASWQFNREAAKKAKVKKSGGGKESKGDLEDIGFADEIGQLSSLVLGLFESESVETLHRRHVDVLKGRSGECSGFTINWDFRTCNFDEIVETEILSLEHI